MTSPHAHDKLRFALDDAKAAFAELQHEHDRALLDIVGAPAIIGALRWLGEMSGFGVDLGHFSDHERFDNLVAALAPYFPDGHIERQQHGDGAVFEIYQAEIRPFCHLRFQREAAPAPVQPEATL